MENKEYINTLLKSKGLLAELEESARERFMTVMLPDTARFIEQLVLLHKPKKILEIGTAIGYSGILMLEVFSGSHLYTIEYLEERAAEAKKNFEQANLADRVTQFIGDAKDIIGNISGEYDFIFIDGPKSWYDNFFDTLSNHLAAGGVIICDNVLFRGYISGQNEYEHRMQTIVANMRNFLDKLTKDERFVTNIYDVGDGLAVSVLKTENLKLKNCGIKTMFSN